MLFLYCSVFVIGKTVLEGMGIVHRYVLFSSQDCFKGLLPLLRFRQGKHKSAKPDFFSVCNSQWN